MSKRLIAAAKKLREDLLLRADIEDEVNVVNASAGIWDEFKAAIEEADQRPLSKLERDGVPSFYVARDDELPPCTHRIHETDIPVWCKTADDAYALMEIIRPVCTRPAATEQGVGELTSWDDQAYRNLADEVEHWKAKAADSEALLERIRDDLGPTYMGEPLINEQHKPTGGGVPDGYTPVRTEVLHWLLGEAGEFEPPEWQREEHEMTYGIVGTYWWRTHLRHAALFATQQPPQPPAVPDAFRETMAALITELEHRKCDSKGNAPGHSHSIPGIWDPDNGELAGKQCAWCALWREAKAMVAGSEPERPEQDGDQ